MGGGDRRCGKRTKKSKFLNKRYSNKIRDVTRTMFNSTGTPIFMLHMYVRKVVVIELHVILALLIVLSMHNTGEITLQVVTYS